MTISPPFSELLGFGSVPDKVSVTFPLHQLSAPVVPEQTVDTLAAALSACFCTLTPIVVLYSQTVLVISDLVAPANESRMLRQGVSCLPVYGNERCHNTVREALPGMPYRRYTEHKALGSRPVRWCIRCRSSDPDSDRYNPQTLYSRKRRTSGCRPWKIKDVFSYIPAAAFSAALSFQRCMKIYKTAAA